MSNFMPGDKYKEYLLTTCQEVGATLLKKGLAFAADKQAQIGYDAKATKEVVVANARYLHRGFFCPSPVQDLIVNNARRGKIIARPTERSRISHRYLFDTSGQLLIAKALLPNGTYKTEYLVYEHNSVYGFAFDAWGTLVGLSEEQYENGKLKNYFCASCFNHEGDNIDLGITNMHYEAYHYDEIGLHDVEFYFITPPVMMHNGCENIDELMQGSRYRFVREHGYLIGLYAVKLNGVEFNRDNNIRKIAVPRKLPEWKQSE